MRHRVIVSVLLTATAALVFAAAGPATTAPTNVIVWHVTLGPNGVTFDKKPELQAGTVGEFKVTNRSTAKRWFAAAGRQTHLLAHNRAESFYVLFANPGQYPWKAGGKGSRVYTGFIQATPCPNPNGPYGCPQGD